jgi:hypothetical protein
VQQAIDASLLAALAAPFTARWAARRLPPNRAAAVLLVSALSSAAGWVWAVGLAVLLMVGRSTELAELGHWSVVVLRHHDPVPLSVSVLALVAVAAGVAGVAAAGHAAYRSIAASRKVASLPHVDRLTVLTGGPPTAATLPGVPGRIVVSSTLLQSLTSAEVRVVLAHERCHLRTGHWFFRFAARMAAGAAPFTRPLARELDLALERWADESAARTVGDRRLVARAVAHAALISKTPTQLGVSGGRVSARVSALLAAPPRSTWLPAAAPLLLVAVALVLGYHAGREVDGLFDFARR